MHFCKRMNTVTNLYLVVIALFTLSAADKGFVRLSLFHVKRSVAEKRFHLSGKTLCV